MPTVQRACVAAHFPAAYFAALRFAVFRSTRVGRVLRRGWLVHLLAVQIAIRAIRIMTLTGLFVLVAAKTYAVFGRSLLGRRARALFAVLIQIDDVAHTFAVLPGFADPNHGGSPAGTLSSKRHIQYGRLNQTNGTASAVAAWHDELKSGFSADCAALGVCGG